MRVQDIDGQLCLVMEHTGDIAKMLDVFIQYNHGLRFKQDKQISARIIERLEEEMGQ